MPRDLLPDDEAILVQCYRRGGGGGNEEIPVAINSALNLFNKTQRSGSRALHWRQMGRGEGGKREGHERCNLLTLHCNNQTAFMDFDDPVNPRAEMEIRDAFCPGCRRFGSAARSDSSTSCPVAFKMARYKGPSLNHHGEA